MRERPCLPSLVRRWPLCKYESKSACRYSGFQFYYSHSIILHFVTGISSTCPPQLIAPQCSCELSASWRSFCWCCDLDCDTHQVAWCRARFGVWGFCLNLLVIVGPLWQAGHLWVANDNTKSPSQSARCPAGSKVMLGSLGRPRCSKPQEAWRATSPKP